MIADQSDIDKTTSELKKATLGGTFDSQLLQPYKAVRDSLTICDRVVLYDGRVVMPSALRKDILNMLHEHHFGIVRMKQLARKYFF